MSAEQCSSHVAPEIDYSNPFIPSRHVYRGVDELYYPRITIDGNLLGKENSVRPQAIRGFKLRPYCFLAEVHWTEIVQINQESLPYVAAAVEDVDVYLPLSEAEDGRLYVTRETVMLKRLGEHTGLVHIGRHGYITSGLFDRGVDGVEFTRPMVLLARRASLWPHQVAHLFNRITGQTKYSSFLRLVSTLWG